MKQVYTNPSVRDLAWALASPPLMLPPEQPCTWYDSAWYRQIATDSIKWLDAVDKQPTALRSLIEAEKDKRLGKYFETLWAFYFQHSPRFELLQRNRQIQHENRTLGELDFIVRDIASAQTIHIEAAIKFYLGVGDTRRASNWHGPNQQDRLDIKLRNLIEKQSVFVHEPVVSAQLQQEGINVDRCAVIMKGRLFYPGEQHEQTAPQHSNPQHLKSRWYRYSDFRFKPAYRYMPLLRSGWMAGQEPDENLCLTTSSQLDSLLERGELRLPLLLVSFATTGEQEKMFVVPDEWTNGI